MVRHLVLFDIDGTILQSGGAGRDAMERALSAVFGTTGDPAYRYDGKTDRQIIREQMLRSGFSGADVDARMESVVELYTSSLREFLTEPTRHVSMYPGVALLLQQLQSRDDTVVGLLTGNIEPGARLKLAAVGLDIASFRVNAFGSDHEARGELPAIAQRRMREMFGLDLAGRELVVIGDTPADIDCGRALGARAIGVATGRYSVKELAQHSPFAVFEDLSDTSAVMATIQS